MSTAPVAAPAAPAPDSGQPGLSQGARIVNTFFAPSKTFTDIKRSAAWWAPFLLMAVFSYGFVAVVAKKVGFEQVVQNQMKLNPKAQERIEQMPADQRAQQMRIQVAVTKGISYGFPVFNLIVLTIIAAILMASFNFGAGAEIPFKQALAVVIYANLVGIVKAALAMVSLLAGADPEGFTFQNPVATNLGYFVDPTTSRALYGLASAVDIIAIWVLLLTGIGFARISKLKTATTISVVFGWYLLVTLVSAGLAAAFS
ncbi:MAG: YIP1 family protein [Acidobacteriota bacterium]|nr:YIP1 family protein [Acidobacteriota bacterium]